MRISTNHRHDLMMMFHAQVVQRRGSFGDHINFTREWRDYKNGFGELSSRSEFWYGNEFLHRLTSNTSATLRVDLVAHDGSSAFAEYLDFR